MQVYKKNIDLQDIFSKELNYPLNTDKKGTLLDTLVQLGTAPIHRLEKGVKLSNAPKTLSIQKPQNNKNTLVQPCTAPVHRLEKGVKLSNTPKTLSIQKPRNDKKTLQNKARRKYLTDNLILKMVDLDSSLAYAYWDAWHCCNWVEQVGQTLKSRYCNCRWCNICNAIRTAKLVNGYLPVLKTLRDKQFVTLTRPNVKGDILSEELDVLQEGFILVKDMIKKRYRRRQGDKLIGIRKTEVTYNFFRNDYHPHYHLILEGKKTAGVFVDGWLGHFPTANEQAQDIRSADDYSVLELFKYVTKVVTSQVDGKRFFDVRALDTIFQAMKGRRTFQPYGGIQKISEDVDDIDRQQYDFLEDRIADWSWAEYDWLDMSGTSKKVLCDYKPSENVEKIVKAIKTGKGF